MKASYGFIETPKLKRSKIDFILVAVRGNAQELAARTARILAVCGEHGASAEPAGGIILATYGGLADEEKPKREPSLLLDALKHIFPTDIKILFGAEVGHSGFLVGSNYIAYNTLLPHLTKARHRLHDLAWGEALEFHTREEHA